MVKESSHKAAVAVHHRAADIKCSVSQASIFDRLGTPAAPTLGTYASNTAEDSKPSSVVESSSVAA